MTLTRIGHRPLHSSQRTGVFVVYSRPSVSGPVVEFQRLEVGESAVIGCGELADIRLADRYVSRRHLRLNWGARRLFVEDLASTNGTVLNATRLGGRRLLQSPSLLELGRTTLLVIDALGPGRPGRVSLGPVDGQAGELLPVVYRTLTGMRSPGAVGEFHRQVIRGLLSQCAPGERERGCLQLLSSQSSLAVGGAHG